MRCKHEYIEAVNYGSEPGNVECRKCGAFWKRLMTLPADDDQADLDATNRRKRELVSEPDESMDGDLESGLASAGWGVDEDYGDFGGNEG